MKGLELICFEMIASNGSARSYFIEAIGEAKEGNFEAADKLMEEGENMLTKGHHEHSKLLTQEASGEKVPVDLLLLHAEDQMMAADTIKLMSEEFIANYKRIQVLESKL